MTTYESRTISVSIDRDWRAVYDFAAEPRNFPRWASGLGSDLEKVGEEWRAQGPEGPIRIRFSAPNEQGVVDQMVTTASGAEILVPMRVMANGTGAEVAFTLFRQPGMSAETFARDADWVARDLATLKSLLEAERTP
jgi:hypothetical protein